MSSSYVLEANRVQIYPNQSKHTVETQSTTLDKFDTRISVDTFGGELMSKKVDDFHNSLKKKELAKGNMSKSYIMAMKSLQNKLEQKDEKITELKVIIESLKSEVEKLNLKLLEKKLETAKFGESEKSKRDKPFYLEISKIGTVNQPESFNNYSRESFMFKENVNPNNFLESNSTKNSLNFKESLQELEDFNRELKEDNYKLAKELDNVSNQFVLAKKKLRISKEKNDRLNQELEDCLNKVALMEELNFKLGAEKKELRGALDNMEELVDIITNGKKDNFLPNFKELSEEKDVFNLTSTIREFHSEVEITYTKPEQNPLVDKTVIHADTVRSSRKEDTEIYNQLITDIINHVLLNKELTLQHLDLYNHIKEGFKDQIFFFESLEENYECLKATKESIMKKNQDITESYLDERVDEDIMTIDNLLSVIRGLLALNESTRLK